MLRTIQRKMVQFLIVGCVVLGGASLLMACGGESSDSEQAVSDDLEQFRLRIEPSVWQAIAVRPWFNRGDPNPDGRRLIKLISDYWLSQRPYEALQVVEAYPSGLSEDTEEALLSLDSSYLVLKLATANWVVDGIDEYERIFLDVLGDAWQHSGPEWTFKQVLLDGIEAMWFVDGVDESEATILKAAGALSGRNQDRAIQLVEVLDSRSYTFQSMNLPESGETTLIITTPSGEHSDQFASVLNLVELWMGKVEVFVGAYNAPFLIVEVVGASESVCGTAQIDLGDVPGFISLYMGCLDDTTIIHELTHVVMRGGPIWFSEGVADLAVYHLTGAEGNYLVRRVNGLIDLNAHRKLDVIGPDTTDEYTAQGSLGAQLLVDVYGLLGPEVTSSVLRDISGGDYPKEGPVLLNVFREATPENLSTQLEGLFDDRFSRAR